MNTNKVDWAAEVQSAVLAMKEEGQKAYTFMKQEAPEVAAEYIQLRRAESLASLIPHIVCVPLLIIAAVFFFRRFRSSTNEMNKFFFMFYGCAALAMVVMTVCFSNHVYSAALKPWVAPRVTLIEGIKWVVR